MISVFFVGLTSYLYFISKFSLTNTHKYNPIIIHTQSNTQYKHRNLSRQLIGRDFCVPCRYSEYECRQSPGDDIGGLQNGCSHPFMMWMWTLGTRSPTWILTET